MAATDRNTARGAKKLAQDIATAGNLPMDAPSLATAQAKAARARRYDPEQWRECLELARDLQRRNCIDQAVRACDLAPEMLGLLVDCARGADTFQGTSAAVRRLAILDVLAIGTGAQLQQSGLFEKSNATELHSRSLSDLEEFIRAGSERLRALDIQKQAIDAIVIDPEPASQQPDNS